LVAWARFQDFAANDSGSAFRLRREVTRAHVH
jgi:hypothetical protein